MQTKARFITATSPRRITSPRVWACGRCDTQLADDEDVKSKQFIGVLGRAYLFRDVVNVTLGLPEERWLITGKHVVSTVQCGVCYQYLGWKYVAAPNKEQQYKVNSIILERTRIAKANNWVKK